MGNAESDRSEQEAQKIINFIPGVNLVYNATRSAVYAAKGDGPEVAKSGIAVVGGLAGGPAGGVLATVGAAALDDALKNKD